MDPQNTSSKRKGMRCISALGTFGLVVVGVLAFSSPSDAVGQRSRSGGPPVPISWSDVFEFNSEIQVEGASSQLVRTNAGVTVTLQTNSLEPGAVYTLWWVVFNEPENCTAGTIGICGLGDLMNEAAMPSLLWATGNVAGGDGTGSFAAHLRVGDPPGEVRFGPGLLDPWGADIHVAVRNHGPRIPRMLYRQLTMFEGGCAPNGGCTNEQFAVHEHEGE